MFRDIARPFEFTVVFGQRSKRNSGIDMVRQVESDVERHEIEAGKQRLAYGVRGNSPILAPLHTAVFGHGAKAIDDSPHREVRKEPQQDVGVRRTRSNTDEEECHLHQQDPSL